MSILSFIHSVVAGHNLSEAEAEASMAVMLEGATTAPQIAAFLTALRMKGETSAELTGFARAMRRFAQPFETGLPPGEVLLDTCGTGGDGPSTFNISTIAAFVVAATGVRVAKHGNRSISSQCGSADVLEALGIRIDLSPAEAARAIREVGIAFLFAPAYHAATRHVQPVRRELKMRTVFNLLGPLVNPAGATVQVVGTTSEHNAELIANALCRLGLKRGYVVHGRDGLDEVTTTTETVAFEISKGLVVRRTLSPQAFGLPRAQLAELRGGLADENCGIARRVLAGERGAARDIVLANAALAMMAAEKVVDLTEGVRVAEEAIDSGGAREKVARLAEFGHAAPSALL
jgi:anthranilate phosphoribosyltransferase